MSDASDSPLKYSWAGMPELQAFADFYRVNVLLWIGAYVRPLLIQSLHISGSFDLSSAPTVNIAYGNARGDYSTAVPELDRFTSVVASR